MYGLAFIEGPLKGRRLTISENLLCVGRGPECGLRLADASVAGRHAELTESGGTLRVRRMQPDAPLAVNGTDIGDEPEPLRPGDVIGIGPHRLRVDSIPADVPRADRRSAGGLSRIAVAASVAMIAVQVSALIRAFQLGVVPSAPADAGTNAPHASPAAAPARESAASVSDGSASPSPMSQPSAEPQPGKESAP